MSGIATYANGVAQSLLTIGYRCWVRVGTTSTDAQKVGFVDSMRCTKQIQLQRAQVCGSIFPASIDPQAITVNVNMSGFLATPSVYNGTQSFNGGGKISLASFNPASSDFVEGKVVSKFAYMDFYDEKKGLVLASFNNVIASSYGVTVNGGTYVKADIALEAMDMSSGKDYDGQTETEVS